MEEGGINSEVQPTINVPAPRSTVPPQSSYSPSNFNLPPAQVAIHVEASSIPPGYAPTPQRPPQIMPPTEGWFARNQRNKPQSNSVGSAIFVLVAGGMNLAWSCGFVEVEGFETDTHILICWYIAAIIGALISAFITNRITKRPLYLFSGFLVLLGGILSVSLPHEYGAIAAARYLNGFAVGLTFVPLLVLIGEEVDCHQRGMIAAILEAGSFTLGIFMQIALFTTHYDSVTSSYYKTFGPTELHGIIVIVFGVLTCIMSYFLVVESPIYYLLRNDENQAIDCLRRLQRPFVVTQETYQQLGEHKRYVEGNGYDSNLGLSALLKLCLYRGLIALSFSPFTTIGLVTSSVLYVGFDTWPFIIFGLSLWLGSFIAAFLIDWTGRKILTLIGALVCGGMAIGAGSIYHEPINILDPTKPDSILYILFVLELFTGIFRSSSSAYLTEAFPLHLKSYYIAISFIVEMLVLLIIECCHLDPDRLDAYFITVGVFFLVFFVLGVLFLPETKKLTLREAQDKFKLERIINVFA
ncbi:facilitated trehalose transporter Tret1-like isoform X1 [Anastrepha ludens]|uniref:facilitated trehalose transporter Tret1-like isoform X1 n=2 Tax=Anastrepha ludens TaxID=28586 RepID=UPI0023AF2276|nr:facilitated trehalose transporter Tret1-like isoform X1 [Anastrepha ludens]XP_053956508.1 facilitated trehalose transporter Tret1-like isoform X1 [Anastrepha ludens]